MKVLLLANFGMGLYNFRKELLEKLISEGFEVYVSFPSDEYATKLEKSGCKIIDTQVDRRGINPFNDLKLLINYVKMINKIKPDVVLTYTIKPNIFGGIACKLTKTPYLANITGLGTAVQNGGILQKTILFLYKISLKDASCVFFQNKQNEEYLSSKNVINGKKRLLPGSGVNLNHFRLLEYPLDDTVNFLFISRVMKEKGIEQYLDAALYIRKKYPNTVFHVVGFCEEEYEEKLNYLDAKGIIKYHGKQSDVKKFYKISHCTIHPTYYPEGMSNVLLESAAIGRPIISTNRSGCKEIIDEGKNGYLIEPKNSKELIEKIEQFIHLPYESKKTMGKLGRQKVEKEFDRKFVIEAYLEEINTILEGFENK